MKKMFLFFSHELTQAQKEDAKNNLLISDFVYLTKELQELWSNIPANSVDLSCYLEPLKIYLKNNAKASDVVLVQGDFGGVYQMVNFIKHEGLKAVYATTLRDAIEHRDGDSIKKISIFNHVMFREY